MVPIGLWNAKILGGSHVFIAYIASLDKSNHLTSLLGFLVVFFLVRFIFSMISYGAAVPGGIFMPILVLGALIGAIAGVVMIHQGAVPTSCYLNLVVISMAAYFGAIEEAPLYRYYPPDRNGWFCRPGLTDDNPHLYYLHHQ